MRTPQAKVRTSQIFFQQDGVTFKNEVIVTCYWPKADVLRAFGIESKPESFDAGDLVEDFGFCAMRVSKHDTIEFVTNMQKLARTIEAVRAFIKAVPKIRRAHAHNPIFTLDLYGSLELRREQQLARVAQAAGCTKKNRWVI